jgi:hypothetical protein
MKCPLGLHVFKSGTASKRYIVLVISSFFSLVGTVPTLATLLVKSPLGLHVFKSGTALRAKR